MPKIRNLMLNEAPTPERVREETKKELTKFKKSSENTLINPPIRKKKDKGKKIGKKNKIIKTQNNPKTTTKKIGKNKKSVFREIKTGKKRKVITSSNNLANNPFLKRKSKVKFNLELTSIDKQDEKKNEDEEINDLPYTRAIFLDKRNVFLIFKSILLQKLEIIYILLGKDHIKIILIGEYILSLFINFFFNALLYTDEVVSNKYHNNGELDVIVTLSLSIISNIITSIICYYIKYSKGIEARLYQIMEIKNYTYFIKNINQFFRFLKIKFICFFISEVIIIAACYYYIVIFCIIYTNSKVSLLVNYIMSLVEGLITSLALAIIIFTSRLIGLKCLNRNFYNISKYINDKF